MTTLDRKWKSLSIWWQICCFWFNIKRLNWIVFSGDGWADVSHQHRVSHFVTQVEQPEREIRNWGYQVEKKDWEIVFERLKNEKLDQIVIWNYF